MRSVLLLVLLSAPCVAPQFWGDVTLLGRCVLLPGGSLMLHSDLYSFGLGTALKGGV
jgi:hypothetical protein